MTRLTLLASANSLTGYGQHAIQIIRQFQARDVFISLRPLDVHEKMGADLPNDIRARLVRQIQPEPWELLLSPPNYTPTPGKRTVFFTMWESSILPDPCLNNVNLAEAVVVPSTWCSQVFQGRGLKPKIFTVPLGVDEKEFKYIQPNSEGPTIFAAAGRTSHGRDRKGLDGTIAAFLAAFPYEQNVRLRVKVHADCELPAFSDHRIEVTRAHLKSDQIVKWLAECHCFVTATQGEGWGLWQHQAMAVGRPVIAPVYGGLKDFIGEGNCYPVRYWEGPTSGQWCGTWAYPDLMSMSQQMRHVHANRSEAADIGRMAFRTVSSLTWERSCSELLQVLSTLGALSAPHRCFNMPKLIYGDYSVKKIPNVIDQATANRWTVEELSFAKPVGEVVFNPSLAGHTWFLRQSKTTDGNRDESFIFASRAGKVKGIALPGLENDWFEDPRAMVHGDGYALSYTRVSKGCPATQELAFLDEALNVIDVWHPDIGNNGLSPQTAKGPEKNWIWFKESGDFFSIQWLEPMTVYRVINGKPVEKFETKAFHPKWLHGIRHGGAHPTRIDDEYFGFCHSLLPWYWRTRSRYFISAYAFSAKPPFRLTRLSREPLLRSEDDLRNNPCSCVIVGGAVLDGDRWTLAVGARDEQVLKIQVPHKDVLATMDAV